MMGRKRASESKTMPQDGALMALYNRGLSDKDMAAEAGTSASSVARFRHRYNLDAHGRKAVRKKHWASQLEKDAHDAEALGLSYGQYKSRYPSGLPD